MTSNQEQEDLANFDGMVESLHSRVSTPTDDNRQPPMRDASFVIWKERGALTIMMSFLSLPHTSLLYYCREGHSGDQNEEK